MQVMLLSSLVSISISSLVAIAAAAPSLLEDRELAERQTWQANCTNNGGTPLCCQGTFAGDLPLIVALAGLTSFPLNPNDVNCIGS